MDRGEAFKLDMRIRPCGDGSFLVGLGVDRDYGRGSISEFAFTNVSDLLDWLVAHAQAFAVGGVVADVTHELTEGDVVKERLNPGYRADIPGVGLGAAIGENPFASLVRPAIRRTSAAEKMFPYAGMSAVDIVREASTEPKPAA